MSEYSYCYNCEELVGSKHTRNGRYDFRCPCGRSWSTSRLETGPDLIDDFVSDHKVLVLGALGGIATVAVVSENPVLRFGGAVLGGLLGSLFDD